MSQDMDGNIVTKMGSCVTGTVEMEKIGMGKNT